MAIIKDYQQVKEVYAEAVEKKISLPVFCAEDRETLEAILAAAKEYGDEIGVDDLPIIPGWTTRYPVRSQMKLVTACGDPIVGTKLMLSDLKVFSEDSSPYGKLRIMPHLDHAFPWLDWDVLTGFADEVASVMCDASEKPFKENIRLTAEYVEKVKGRVLVEGCVEEIYEGPDKIKNVMTTVEQAVKFIKETGVDIIVPNVGTEHRSVKETVKYDDKRSREISEAVGKILCLHGTSSVKAECLSNLAKDGFVKVNIYTTLAVSGGQAIARYVLKTLGNILTIEEIEEMIQKKILGENIISPEFSHILGDVKPKLEYVTNPLRRDEWFNTVKNRCKGFMKMLNYSNYAK